MGLLNQKKRVDLGGGEWVDVRPLSLAALSNANYRLHVPYLWLRDDYEEVLLGQRFGTPE